MAMESFVAKPEHPEELTRAAVDYFMSTAQTKGELLIDSHSIIATFDLKSGTVALQSAQQSKFVTNEYNPDTFNFIHQPIMDAIGIVAKVNLLGELSRLGDPKLSAIINKHFGSDGKLINVTLVEVNKALMECSGKLNSGSLFTKGTLFSATNSGNPIQRVVHDVLSHYDITKINSTDAAKKVMGMITAKLSHLPNEMKPRQPQSVK